MNLSIKLGFGVGFLTIFYFAAFYLLDKSLILSSGIYWLSFLISIIGMWYVGEKACRIPLAFHKVLQQVFLVWVISTVLFHVWSYFIFNYDTTLLEIQRQQILSAQENYLKAAKEMEQIQQIRADIDFYKKEILSYTIKDALIGLGRGLVGGFGLAYGVTYLLNKKHELG